jgi:Family of unknown function (DUF6603)
MADEAGTLERLAEALAAALEPLADKLKAGQVLETFDELGLAFPGDLQTEAAFLNALGEAIRNAQDLPQLADQLIQATENENAAAILAAGAAIIAKAAEVAEALDAVATQLSALAGALPNVDAGEAATFAAQLVERLLGYAVIEYLFYNHPTILHLLALVGLVEINFDANADDPDLRHPVFIKRVLKLERLGDLLKDPLDFLRTEYGWGDQAFDGKLLLQRIEDLLYSLGIPAEFQAEQDDQPLTLELILLNIRPNRNLNPPGLNISIEGALGVAGMIAIPLSDTWRLELSTQAALDSGVALSITPPASASLISHAAVEGAVTLAIVGATGDPQRALPLIGSSNGTRLEAHEVRAGLLGEFRWDPGSSTASADLSFEGKVSGGRLVIDSSSPDGFLKKVLPSGGFALDFDFTIGWSTSRGLYFSGSGGMETTVALNLTLGPLVITMLHVRLAISAEGALELEGSVGITARIGPISAAIDRIGALTDINFRRGNLGPIDFAVNFKPPTAIGIAVDAGPVSGGGFISFDEPNHRYSGILHLEILSVSITAIALIETKLPDGRDGYSFLLIVCVEFSPIQLGFGFTLNGVGGLAGIHRSMYLEALRTGLYTGSLDHILFPQDPISNAPQLISDLSRIFPVAQGQFTFGPMAKLGWGAGNIITISLGIVIQLPSPVRIALLGQIGAYLPSPDDAVVELHIDFVASIDFEAKLFALDASLRDSRIVVFTLTGDMAMRLSWGDQPNFAFALGGFHPHFPTPPGFPALRRLTLALGSGDWIRLNCQTYQAITSNSLQFGARLELYVDVGVYIHGWLGFDALVIFSPFSFEVDFTAGLEVAVGSVRVASISVDGSLSGPTPWRVRGEAKISLLFFEISAHVDEKFGRKKPATLPALDPWPDMLAAAEDSRNWAAVLPAGVIPVASLAAGKGDTAVLIDAAGCITWREHVAPLDRRLTLYKNAATPSAITFTVDLLTVGTTASKPSTVDDFFAQAQFEELSDAEKLSLPSFERMHGGIQVSGTTVHSGQAVPAAIEYETKLIDSATESRTAPSYALPLRVQMAHVRGSAAARSALRNGGLRAFGSDRKLQQAEELFEVASTNDLSRRADITAPTTKGGARQALNAYLADRPSERQTLQVVPVGEAEGL